MTAIDSAEASQPSSPSPADGAAPPRPVQMLPYAPRVPSYRRLPTAVAVALVAGGALLVVTPMLALAWAGSAEYTNPSAERIVPFGWASAGLGAAMIVMAVAMAVTHERR